MGLDLPQLYLGWERTVARIDFEFYSIKINIRYQVSSINDKGEMFRIIFLRRFPNGTLIHFRNANFAKTDHFWTKSAKNRELFS